MTLWVLVFRPLLPLPLPPALMELLVAAAVLLL